MPVNYDTHTSNIVDVAPREAEGLARRLMKAYVDNIDGEFNPQVLSERVSEVAKAYTLNKINPTDFNPLTDEGRANIKRYIGNLSEDGKEILNRDTRNYTGVNEKELEGIIREAGENGATVVFGSIISQYAETVQKVYIEKAKSDIFDEGNMLRFKRWLNGKALGYNIQLGEINNIHEALNKYFKLIGIMRRSGREQRPEDEGQTNVQA